MDTSTLGDRADTLGRRVVPRRHRSLEDKLRIVGEARVPGASVAAVARANGVNANLVFAWMRQQEQGLLATRTRSARPALLAVTIEPKASSQDSTACRATVPRDAGPPSLRDVSPAAERIEVELPGGTFVRAYGAVSWEGLERVLCLLRR